MKATAQLCLCVVTLCAAFPALSEEPPVVLPIQRLSMDMALKAAQASIDACRKKGLNIAVTVVDRGGHEQVTLRDTLTVPITVTVSKQKAYAAMNFNVPTSALENRFTSPFSPGKVDGIVLSTGALPIEAGGTIIGGIGVSGAPSGETDEECAAAGLEVIRAELEMAL